MKERGKKEREGWREEVKLMFECDIKINAQISYQVLLRGRSVNELRETEWNVSLGMTPRLRRRRESEEEELTD